MAGIQERLDAIRDNTEEIKKQNDTLRKTIDDGVKAIMNMGTHLEWRIKCIDNDRQAYEIKERLERTERVLAERIDTVEEQTATPASRFDGLCKVEGMNEALDILHWIKRDILDKNEPPTHYETVEEILDRVLDEIQNENR
jgi:hypothetical protein